MSRSVLITLALFAAFPTRAAQFGPEIVLTTDAGLTSIDVFASVDDDGEFGFTGMEDGDSKVFVTDPTAPGGRRVLSFFGSGRTWAGASINQGPGQVVAVRDVRSSTWHVRKWPTDGSTQVIVGGSPEDFDSAQLYMDVNAAGTVVFSGRINGSTDTALLAGSELPPTQLEVFPGSVQVRPQLSDDGRVVYRDGTDAIVVRDIGTGERTVVAAPPEHAGSGREPGISADGTVAAFVATDATGEHVFLAVEHAGGRWVEAVTGSTPESTFDDIDETQRVGVAARGIPGDQTVTVVFAATRDGIAGVHVLEVRTTEVGPDLLLAPGPAKALLRVGDSLVNWRVSSEDRREVQSFRLHDPMSPGGRVGLRVGFSDGTAGLVRACTESCPEARPRSTVDFTKFKQFAEPWQGRCLLPSEEPDCACESGLPPEARPIGSFHEAGCTLSSVATVLSAHLTAWERVDPSLSPESVRDDLLARGQIHTCETSPLRAGSIADVGELFFVRDDIAVWFERAPMDDWSAILHETARERPVIMAVPRQSVADNTRTRMLEGLLHYVVGYALDGSCADSARSVLINDPGYGASAYGDPDLAGGVPDYGAEDVHVTLQDYFSAMTRRATLLRVDYPGCWGTEPVRDDERVRLWFDEGQVHWVDGADALSPGVRRKLVTKSRSAQLDTLPRLPPGLTVASPVEVAVTDDVTGTRYVSDAGIAGPGDVVLDRTPSVVIAPPEDESLQVIDPAHLPYTLRLPLELFDRSLGVEIIGLARGWYAVTYHHRGVEYLNPPPLYGEISEGETRLGRFDLVPATPPILVTLRKDAGTAGVLLTWTGGRGPFMVSRSNDPRPTAEWTVLTPPAGVNERTWLDAGVLGNDLRHHYEVVDLP